MSRSTYKGPYVHPKLLKRAADANWGTATKPIRTWARSSQIPPELVNKWLEVHTGNKFVKLFVKEDMVGHRLGEFAPSRTFRGHGRVVKRTMDKT